MDLNLLFVCTWSLLSHIGFVFPLLVLGLSMAAQSDQQIGLYYGKHKHNGVRGGWGVGGV